jgi:hypothetical protein
MDVTAEVHVDIGWFDLPLWGLAGGKTLAIVGLPRGKLTPVLP